MENKKATVTRIVPIFFCLALFSMILKISSEIALFAYSYKVYNFCVSVY